MIMAKSVQAIVRNLPASDGGKPFYSGYRPNLHFEGSPDGDLHGVTVIPEIECVMPGQTVKCTVRFRYPEFSEKCMFVGSSFVLQDGPFIRATGMVAEINPDQ